MTPTSVSLLERLATKPDEADWRRLYGLYLPFILHCLRRDPTLHDEADDLAHEVLVVVVRELPGFERRRAGSFRAWLRTITYNRLKAFWQARRRLPQSLGSPGPESFLAQLEDPNSDLSRLWDEEHHRHVVRRLLEIIEDEFEANTLQAFRRVVFDAARPADVATELAMSENAVLIAKSRVLNRLRQEGEGLLE